jgi:hypothetical protein
MLGASGRREIDVPLGLLQSILKFSDTIRLWYLL